MQVAAYNQPGRGQARRVFNVPDGDPIAQSLDRPEDATSPGRGDATRELNARLAKKGMRVGWYPYQWKQQEEQEAQAEKLRASAQQPTADGVDNNGSPFQTNRDLFPTDVVNQVRRERNISAAEMKPANITPGAKAVGKGGVITDSDMNIGAAGSAINPANDRRYMGRAEFKRAKFYGR